MRATKAGAIDNSTCLTSTLFQLNKALSNISMTKKAFLQEAEKIVRRELALLNITVEEDEISFLTQVYSHQRATLSRWEQAKIIKETTEPALGLIVGKSS